MLNFLRSGGIRFKHLLIDTQRSCPKREFNFLLQWDIKKRSVHVNKGYLGGPNLKFPLQSICICYNTSQFTSYACTNSSVLHSAAWWQSLSWLRRASRTWNNIYHSFITPPPTKPQYFSWLRQCQISFLGHYLSDFTVFSRLKVQGTFPAGLVRVLCGWLNRQENRLHSILGIRVSCWPW